MLIVLDTTYILPIFNIEIDVFRKEDLKVLLNSKIEKLVPPHILIEAKWVLYSLIKRGVIRDFNRAVNDFNDGLQIIREKNVFKLAEYPDPEVDLIESKIFRTIGLRDYFDRIILATAKVYDAVLLTEDNELLKLSVVKYPELLPVNIMNWGEFKKEYLSQET